MTTQSLPKHAHHASPDHEPPAALRATGIVVMLAVVIAIVAIAFALPAARSKPHDVPIGAAGPQAASGQVADILEQNAPGAFEITYYPGEAALRRCDPQPRRLRRHLVRAGRAHPADRHRRQPDRRPAAEPGRQRHRPARRRAAAHRRPGPADRRRPARRRAGGVRTADHAGRPAARDRAGARAAARGVDPVRGRRGVRWAGRLDDRRAAALRPRLDRRELLGRCWRADARRTGLRAVRCWALARCSAASGSASARCWRCCWATRYPA